MTISGSPYSSSSHPLLSSHHRNQNGDFRDCFHKSRARITPVPVNNNSDNFWSSSEYTIDFDPNLDCTKGLMSDYSPNYMLEDDMDPTIFMSKDSVHVVPPYQHEHEIRLAFNTHNRIQASDDLSLNSKERYLKTGTTIVGVQTRECIILAADTRATEGSVVADMRCEKVHQLCQNVWCCGAGTSGDLDALTRKVRYTSLLKTMVRDTVGNGGMDDDVSDSCRNDIMTFQSEEELDINSNLGKDSLATICHIIREDLTRGRGQIGANLVLGGVDPFTQQPILVAIHPHGSIDVVPYTALGSGGLAAMGILESRYHTEMSLEEGVELVKDAVLAGIKNDLGSGSQVRF